MKKTIILMILLCVTVVTFGQVVQQDSTGSATVIYTFGDSLNQFLSKNWATIVFTLLFLLSEWLGQTGKVKEGSVWAWIINLVLKLVKSKATGVQTKKAKFMKVDDYIPTNRPNNVGSNHNHFRTVILICLLSTFGMSLSAQVHTKHFFGEITKTDIKTFKDAKSTLNLKAPLSLEWFLRGKVTETAWEVPLFKGGGGQWATTTGIGLSLAAYDINAVEKFCIDGIIGGPNSGNELNGVSTALSIGFPVPKLNLPFNLNAGIRRDWKAKTTYFQTNISLEF